MLPSETAEIKSLTHQKQYFHSKTDLYENIQTSHCKPLQNPPSKLYPPNTSPYNSKNPKKSYAQYKTLHSLPSQTKIFQVTKNQYHTIRTELLSRGWVENKDHNSPFFDLKFVTKAKEVNFPKAGPWQIINHQYGTTGITTKNGLNKNLRSFGLTNGGDVGGWFPRCYEVGQKGGLRDFLVEFKLGKFEGILRSVMGRLGGGGGGWEGGCLFRVDELAGVALGLVVGERKVRNWEEFWGVEQEWVGEGQWSVWNQIWEAES